MDDTSAAADAAALNACFFYVLTKDDYYCLVNTKCVNQVVTGVLRLCLEYGVHEDVDQAVAEFVQFEEEKYTKEKSSKKKKSMWFAKYGVKFQYKSYKDFDTTNLLEIITKVTDLKPDCKDLRLLSLRRSLREIKNIRNDVMHVGNNATHSEGTASRISDKVNEIVDLLGDLHNIKSAKVAEIKLQFHTEIQEIKDNQQTNKEKIMFAIKKSIIKENRGKWVKMMINVIKYEKLPFSNRQVSLSDMFHETIFEVELDPDNPGNRGNQILETISCNDIFSLENTTNIDIIEGDPGSGKTTMLRMICFEFCKRNVNSNFKFITSFSMMILINCRDNDNIRSFWQYFQTYYQETAEVFSERYVISTLRDLKMIVAIDGLDEGNEAANALVRDVIKHFAGSETMKFLITARRGFSKTLVKLLDEKAVQYRMLNIMPMKKTTEQEQFIRRVVKQIPEINEKDIIPAFRRKQVELSSYFLRPLGLILFITLFDLFPGKIEKLTHELGLMQLTYEIILEKMANRMPEITNSLQCSRAIMKITGRHCLQWIQNNIYEIDQQNFNKFTSECYEKHQNIPVASVVSCVLIQQKTRKATITTTHDFLHRSLQEYLASKVLTEKLEHTRSGNFMRILKELTRELVTENDLARLVIGCMLFYCSINMQIYEQIKLYTPV